MTESPARTRSTRVSRIIKAPREAIYRAFLEPEAVAKDNELGSSLSLQNLAAFIE